MKPVLKLVTAFYISLLFNTVNAQVLKKIGNKVEQKAKDRLERKVDETIDNGLDKTERGIDSLPSKMGKRKKKKNTQSKEEDKMPDSEMAKDKNSLDTGNHPNTNENSNTKSAGTPNQVFTVDSKFDFVPGDKIVLLEDFSSYPLGDFPGKWVTNGTGEIVKNTDENTRYLKVTKEAVFYPGGLKPLPDEFTLECDLLCNEDFNYYSYEFAIGITNAKDLKTQWNYFGRFGHGGENNSRVEMLLHPNDEGNKAGLTYFVATHQINELLRSNANQNQLSVRAGNTKVHISIWRQKQRVRVYLNDKKVWDIPNALEAGVPINSIYFRSNGTDNDRDAYFLTNIKLATENPNTKKLLTEGKFSTSNILFDVNNDKIKPESYGVLKEIAATLSDNALIKVKIVGHTDSDGDDAANLTLSHKRAVAVKQALIKNFRIEDARMQTDGKGEVQPIVPNNTTEAKAQNRRVEFIKL